MNHNNKFIAYLLLNDFLNQILQTEYVTNLCYSVIHWGILSDFENDIFIRGSDTEHTDEKHAPLQFCSYWTHELKIHKQK